jgi:starvation-inducible DNA-binding protein
MTMYRSPSQLGADERATIAGALNANLADGLDLWTQLKLAHWNVRGPLFPSLHPLFETMASGLALHNDAIAERAVTLGALARGSARHVARASRLPDYPDETTRDLAHVELLAERIVLYLAHLREGRAIAEKNGDTDTVDLYTQIITEFEKHAWFLRATLAA